MLCYIKFLFPSMKRLVVSPKAEDMADAAESSSEAAPQSAPTAPTPPGGGAGVLRVLLAEDEQFQRDAFTALFSAANKRLGEKLKFELTLVCCADEVLSSIRETTDWQLVLLDINMPGTSGAEIIADVRAALGDRVPVLMISGAAHMGAVHNCLRQGADLCAGAADCQPRLSSRPRDAWSGSECSCRTSLQVHGQATARQRHREPLAACPEEGPDVVR